MVFNKECTQNAAIFGERTKSSRKCTSSFLHNAENKRMSDLETSIMSFSFDDLSPAGMGAEATYTDETNAFWLSTNQ